MHFNSAILCSVKKLALCFLNGLLGVWLCFFELGFVYDVALVENRILLQLKWKIVFFVCFLGLLFFKACNITEPEAA